MLVDRSSRCRRLRRPGDGGAAERTGHDHRVARRRMRARRGAGQPRDRVPRCGRAGRGAGETNTRRPGRAPRGTRLIGYPIVPLLNQMGSEAPEVAAAIHWGATTQDIMDSGVAFVLRGALARIEVLMIEVGDAAAILADGHRGTAMVGRTHAQPAVPTTFGAKAAVWVAEFARHCDRLRAAGQPGRRVVLVRSRRDVRGARAARARGPSVGSRSARARRR